MKCPACNAINPTTPLLQNLWKALRSNPRTRPTAMIMMPACPPVRAARLRGIIIWDAAHRQNGRWRG